MALFIIYYIISTSYLMGMLYHANGGELSLLEMILLSLFGWALAPFKLGQLRQEKQEKEETESILEYAKKNLM